MITAEAFKAIEQSLVAAATASVAAVTYQKYKDIQKALDAGDYDRAYEVAGSISLTQAASDLSSFVGYITNVAMLFGASRVTKNPGTTVVGLGFEKITAAQMADTYRQMIANKGSEVLKAAAMQLIASHKEPVQKAEPWDRPDLTIDPATGKRRVLTPFESFMDEAGKAYLNVASSLHTSRASAYGFTAEAAALGIEEYQINEQLDSRACPVCRVMHGKVFKVKDARSMLDIVCRVVDPNDIKQLQPWPKQSAVEVEKLKGMTTAELVTAGLHVPPFHPRCRGLLARRGKAPTLSQIDSNKVPPDDYTAGKDDFDALKVRIAKEKIKLWNELVRIAPADVLAALRGTTPDVLLASMAQGGKDTENVAISVKKGSIRITDTGLALGGGSAVSVSLSKAGLQLLSLVANSDMDTAELQGYMRGLYSLASDLKAKSMMVAASGGQDSYAWARFGFVPSAKDWPRIKKAMAANLTAEKIDSIGSDAAVVVAGVLSSPEPKDLFALVDLDASLPTGDFIGEVALEGVSFVANLAVDDPESVGRFLAYFGA